VPFAHRRCRSGRRVFRRLQSSGLTENDIAAKTGEILADLEAHRLILTPTLLLRDLIQRA
jgi:hypothetical protein